MHAEIKFKEVWETIKHMDVLDAHFKSVYHLQPVPCQVCLNLYPVWLSLWILVFSSYKGLLLFFLFAFSFFLGSSLLLFLSKFHIMYFDHSHSPPPNPPPHKLVGSLIFLFQLNTFSYILIICSPPTAPSRSSYLLTCIPDFIFSLS